MASNLVNVNLSYIEIELCIAQLGTQVRRLGTKVRGNILAVSISGAALPYSAVWAGKELIFISIYFLYQHFVNITTHHNDTTTFYLCSTDNCLKTRTTQPIDN